MTAKDAACFAAINDAIALPATLLSEDIQIVATDEPLFERMVAGMLKGHFEVIPKEMADLASDPNEVNTFLRRFRGLANYKYDQEYICDLWEHALVTLRSRHNDLEPISFQI